MNPPPSSHARDAGLRRLVLAKRWLLAGSVTLTGVLTAVAANAFPGKTIKSSGVQAANAGHSSKTSTHQTQSSSSSLKPPAQAPQSTTAQEPAPAHESTPAPESAPAKESAPAHESTPAPESAPAQESAPAKESAPAQEPAPVEHSEPAPQPAPEAPVVSGGS
jgi:outer membrane biosynthesis protein TonB